MKSCFATRFLRALSFAALSLGVGLATANACSVCGVAKEEARGAYYATTAVMSFLPLCMIGAVIYYLIKKTRSQRD
ncbi:hypothetical protein [Pelagicoccus sp. SDUM812003]|uniref:hypothetical protein n=1 Tax=Pelagicoccus sp. SDUM812003 TaxID=3041267 RepID=UPI00280E7B64|nr:hypothetical protein [Pelagicoccus sp. SDUM812003]MDQ8204940.1 hypothetical protein [Pelagicoccus sp. SDUM812003]